MGYGQWRCVRDEWRWLRRRARFRRRPPGGPGRARAEGEVYMSSGAGCTRDIHFASTCSPLRPSGSQPSGKRGLTSSPCHPAEKVRMMALRSSKIRYNPAGTSFMDASQARKLSADIKRRLRAKSGANRGEFGIRAEQLRIRLPMP